MKLTKTLNRFKTRFLTKFIGHDTYFKSFVSLIAVALLGAVVWIAGPYVTWGDNVPLAQTDKRLYVIISFFLLWLLKFLMLDQDTQATIFATDENAHKRLQALQNRFRGALSFMQKTTVMRQGKLAKLNLLPWYLLVGPLSAGKTTLLANAEVNYVLQKQFSAKPGIAIESSENCDWWITRDLSIIDVPGKYISNAYNSNSGEKKSVLYAELWKAFLRLIKRQRGKHGIEGILFALPLPEIMKQNDLKKYQGMIAALLQNIQELKSIFPHSIPCHLIITKCDLLSGFTEFFAESDHEEIAQAWGVALPVLKSNERLPELFIQRFNALIKKLNEQLLWRLHQERNPNSRPAIKDFPLEIERLKESTLIFIKSIANSQLGLSLQGIYLTSAKQNNHTVEPMVIEDTVNTKERAIKIFSEPTTPTRSYFIKQLITNALTGTQSTITPAIKNTYWKRRIAYAASACAIAATALLLGQDFQHGVKKAYAIQNNLAEYHLAIQQMQDPDEHLTKTLDLLNKLQPSTKSSSFQLDLSHLLSFYSHKSDEKAKDVYQQALQSILIPEIKNYIGETLKNPVNKNIEYLYQNLKAYIMLGDPLHFQTDYVATTLAAILPKSLSATAKIRLLQHANLALKTIWIPQSLDTNLIQETRKYLFGMPSLELGYIILKTIENNNLESEVNLGTNSIPISVFVSNQVSNQVPVMFTGKAFTNILTQETITAAVEAINGNWILGTNNPNKTSDPATPLIEQLRNTYISHYIDVWESLIANIQLSTPDNLTQTDLMISALISTNSPLLQLLQTLRENTYFEPITNTSPKLQNLGLLLDKNEQAGKTLYEIFNCLQSLHLYLQTILLSENEKKTAFEAVSNRMLHHGAPDVITQIFLVAEQSPEPVKIWLEKLGNDTWHYLMQDASRYIDLSWQEQVAHLYQAEIADRYPFNNNTQQEVDLGKFMDFFGNEGIMPTFYKNYLQAFVDTSAQEWQWKNLDNEKLPFSDDTLRQIQQAMHINHTFFPNGSKKLNVQFALQPYKIGKDIKSISLRIDDNQIVDERSGAKIPHVLAWPSMISNKMTSLTFTMNNSQMINRDYPGAWGWFKLVNQSFESAISHKAMLINLSLNEQPAKYLLYTENPSNPFLPSTMRQFHLPVQLTTQKL